METKEVSHSFLKTIGQIIGLYILYFIIGAAWNGIYDRYQRNRGRVPSEDSGEMFGVRAFFLWVCSIIGLIVLASYTEPVVYIKVLRIYTLLTLIFIGVTLSGLIYFFRNLRR
jgi:hypothetical protein